MASLMPNAKQPYWNNAGAPLSGGKIYTYAAGTTTPKATYTTAAGDVPNENPVPLDARGEAAIYWDGSYYVEVKDASGVLVYSADNYTEPASLVAALRADLAASTGAAQIGGAGQVVSSIVSLRALLKTSASTKAFVTGYYADGDGGGGAYYYDSTDATSADNGGSIIVATDGGRWKLTDTASFRVEQFGAKPDGVTDCTSAILAAVTALRRNPVSILDNIGGNTITAYSSGVVEFGPGVFVVSPDALQFTQDLGLTLRGKGSRRTNNAVRAATTLLISGTSAGYGISFSGSGARGATIEDMDICYATSSFTGNVIDSLNCPGLTMNRVFVGTFGLTGGTRLQTANSLLRVTYDEFHHFTECVFDGAVDGWWADDVRALNANTFGGSVTKFDNCVFYDFTGRMLRQDGNRTREGLIVNGCAFNPISVNCVRAVDLNNIDGLTIIGGVLAGSVSNKASTEWMRLVNCTGSVRGVCFDDLSKAGTMDGMLEISGNRIFSTDGITLVGGVIVGRANEFGKGTNGWVLSPTYQLTADLGPDLFKAGVTTSYYVPTDSTSLSGRIHYDSENDASASKFSNVSARVQIRNVSEKQISVPTTSFSPSIVDSGRTFVATGAASQTFTVGSPSPGLKFKFVKTSSVGFRIDASVTGQLYIGTGGVKTSVIAAAGDVGGSAEFEAYGTAGWIVRLSGTWTLS